jgi:FKBP-type peptidyl-prolyl cis-trans isomerase 2
MKVKRRNFELLLILLAIAVIPSACDLGNDYEELQLEHDKSMLKFMTDYNITPDDSLVDNIYVKVLTNVEYPVYATGEDYVVVDLIGIDDQGNAFDVTDSAKADSLDVYRPDVVYGPLRVYLQNTFSGFYKAMQAVPEGAEALMLFPHTEAFGGYEPLLYKVKLYQIIDDINSYIDDDFEAYKDILGVDDLVYGLGDDSIYYKPISEVGDTNFISYGDNVTINLTARYVETDPTYVKGSLGREFFPINESGDSITFTYGTAYFPVTEAVSLAVEKMMIGDTWEVLCMPKYAYGDDGFRHPLLGSFIVPRKMPIHYTITLQSVNGYKP